MIVVFDLFKSYTSSGLKGQDLFQVYTGLEALNQDTKRKPSCFLESDEV
ncbi:hypothetical protein IC006_0670 [Sulfuracidifex tepidarius]|uniref:Uncharacterized protein n=1 Tax=Sulfuracidifex tepidarius TaxID=1294262 RepID=A0A510DT53_9CREN|nr:hypothetical protein IC006_0670 [Sulfuracidifex tepidarius]BBG26139.1 hypothetical protein IC007_0644 [Sulfuracidifex tepidarius]